MTTGQSRITVCLPALNEAPRRKGMDFARRRDAHEVVGGPRMPVLGWARRRRCLGAVDFVRHHVTNYMGMYATGRPPTRLEPYR